MPRPNQHRRRALADAAIALLAERGAHGLTHRAVETRAGVPAGTATNYFRSREGLLVTAAERIVELHLDEAARATNDAVEDHGSADLPPEAVVRTLVDLLTDSLWTAVTTLRGRYLAILELQLEARRRPALAAVLAGLSDTALASTARLHEDLGTLASETAVSTLITLYGGALFTLTTRPEELLDRASVRALTEAMVRGALGLD
ncbi:TetR/AcrR family transcriptional regulator [Nocardiopsis sp. L17-MgMaSL7]|uniref:TetR/AcrR family transcriptional regulator n=1 Tax=Nocardiopsis sp. L17-MgMaSL7 TaxID=1938893 RepID=UPI000D715BC7|nr:TetR/AcrR family transcriptional regulator [Nocardiopsis sp. L17-MgMaSL7]PWV46854.1 TetR family transcriptional regulator [Nocardiopsis sp. L17-MgMaSL7]